MVRSDTDVLKATPSYSHSLSAPSELDGVQDDSILEIIRLQRYCHIPIHSQVAP